VRRVSRLSIITGLVICAILLLGIVAACGGSDEALTLDGTKWIMTTYAVTGAMKNALATPVVDANFAAPKDGKGEVAGSGGVNQYTGSYTVDGSKLTVGAVSSTRMTGDPAAMQQETAYLMNLQAAASYEIAGSNLTIKNNAGVTVLTYKASQ
jgi:heat shock protein HslJ